MFYRVGRGLAPAAGMPRPTNTNGLPIWNVGRDLRVPPPCRIPSGAALLKSTASAVTTLFHSSLSLLTLTKKAAVRHSRWGGDGGLAAYAAGIAPSADGALGRLGTSRRARRGCFAGCGQREFRPLRRATGGAASGLRDLGCPPPVGKSGRRGILRQGKVWFRSHTGCMARSRTAAMAEKARRAPQTHGWWAGLAASRRVIISS